ncbi:unnamed protein product [Bursaphelenchus xylophilus]|uniref:(pine wood nematode) hypothetical protein n=1 Tax=Bursaphelenchus xylophilus TaxID=6326 RepID=A0A1I7RTQ9_BURXY|nr:unnamed protein product [Bursaphelenchus xylophilus]CAG9122206.1 unnamed protein product [Bursaphelenchus xylophilus]
MGVLGVAALVGLLTFVVYWIVSLYKKAARYGAGIQGPDVAPVIGNIHQLRFRPDEFFEQAQGLGYMLKGRDERIATVYLGPVMFVMIYGAEECEAVLGGQKTLTKMFHYNFLTPWIGQGLLISKPEKWRPRRKLLTPTFHYDILKDFVQVYNRHAATLLSKFDKLSETGEYADIFHTITLCTLDIICESALGCNIQAQEKVNSEYLDAVFRMKYIIHQRQVKPFYYPDIIWNLFGYGREEKKLVNILHDFTGKVIMARKKAVDEAGGVQKLLEEERISGHSRMAFLDLMLDMMDKGQLDMEGLQEEVDTFTFEGHDTTSAAMNWFLHLMGNNPEIQAKVQREVDEVLGETGIPTFEDLGKLKYLEACFKETLRLYPSVPLFARQMTEDTKVHRHILPKGTGVVIIPSMVHRDERFWQDPEAFNPERFIDSDLKHPYAYIPFSAGSRNCIGQRFAMMEEKCVISQIMRRFRVKSLKKTHEMRVAAELIIRPMYGNDIKFERRQFGDYTQISC